MLRPIYTTLFIILSGLLLSACESEESRQQRLTQAQSLTPHDPALNAIYQRSCVACHANGDTKAPLTGDTQAWQARLSKGMPKLLDSVINGYAGMPPYGLCMDCNQTEFEQLIQFMSQTDPL